MEKWINGLKTDIKLAIRTVNSGWKTYSAVFVAVFLIQMLFGIIGLARENSRIAERETIFEQYDSHIELTRVNDSDFYFILESANAELQPYYEVNPYSFEQGYYTAGIYFPGDPQSGLAAFLEEFALMFEENSVVYTKTPLYNFDTAGAGDTVRYGILLAFVGGISLILLTILNNIRINHFKFGYGIYMSFGADFKRLSRSTVCETLYIFSLTYIPAMLIAWLTVTGMSLWAGGGVIFSVMPFVLALVIPFVVSILATVIPIRWLTLRRPSSVMLAADNANHVISPRRSRMIFASKFPYVPEFLSSWRFSGYGMKLVLSGTLFSLLFTCGIYSVAFYDGTLDLPSPQYTINMTTTDPAFVKEMSEINGITVLNGAKTDASYVYSHLLLDKDMVKKNDGFLPYPNDSELMATLNVIYRAADDDLPQALKDHYGYKVSGDPKKIINDPTSLIISDSVSSERVLDIAPGDTIYIAVSGSQSERFSPNEIHTGNGLLRVHLESYTFTYRAFTVAAVIHNEPSREGLCIYLPTSAYEELTGTLTTDWSVYVDPMLSDAEFETTDSELRTMIDRYGTAVLQDHETRTLRNLARSHNYTAVYSTVFCIVLALVPLVWFFSLILFNEKRHGELDVYRALGATDKELKRMFVLSGSIYAVAGMIVYGVLAPICTFCMRRILTSEVFFVFFLQSYADKPVYLSAFPDLWVYLSGLILTALSAFMAAYVSHRIYRKRESEHISENFSQEG